MSEWCFVSAMLIGWWPVRRMIQSIRGLYSGTDISSYATIKADKESKKTSIEILKGGGCGKCMAGENSNPIFF